MQHGTVQLCNAANQSRTRLNANVVEWGLFRNVKARHIESILEPLRAGPPDAAERMMVENQAKNRFLSFEFEDARLDCMGQPDDQPRRYGDTGARLCDEIMLRLGRQNLKRPHVNDFAFRSFGETDYKSHDLKDTGDTEIFSQRNGLLFISDVASTAVQTDSINQICVFDADSLEYVRAIMRSAQA